MKILTRALPACLAAALVFISASCNKKTPVSDVSTAETTAASAVPAEYTSQVKVLCYNVYYQDVGRRQSDIIDFINRYCQNDYSNWLYRFLIIMHLLNTKGFMIKNIIYLHELV